MKRILIMMERDRIGRHKGGPMSYLEPILRRSQDFYSVSVEFLPATRAITIRGASAPAANMEKPSHLRSFLSRFRFYQALHLWREIRHSRFCDTAVEMDFSGYNALFFHDSYTFWAHRKNLKNYSGIVFFQSHCPKPRFLEVIEDSDNELYGLAARFNRKYFEQMDRFAFERADIVVFPCKEAEEPYFRRWSYYRKKREMWDQKYRYLLTGIEDPIPALHPINLRTRYGIPSDALILAFAGRHIKTKGYDLFLKLGKKYANSDRVFFVACGRYDKKVTPKTKNWIEIGQTDEVLSIVNECDFLCSFNRDTYFDLGVLESIAIGRPLIMRYNGGNKVFKRLCQNHVLTFSTKKQLFRVIRALLDSSTKMPADSKEHLRAIYNRFFAEDNFLLSFERLMDSVIPNDD